MHDGEVGLDRLGSDAVGGVLPTPEDDTGATRGSLRAGMGFAAGSFMASVVIGLVSSVVTARLYGVGVIGQYALVTAPWLLLTELSSMSEQKALTRELATSRPRDPRVTALFVPVLLFSFGLTALVALPVLGFTIGGLHGPIDQPELVVPAVLVVVGYVVIDNTSWNIDAVLSSFIAGRDLALARVSQLASFPVIAVLLYPASRSVWSLTIATILSFAVALLVRLGSVRRFMRFRVPAADVRDGFRELPSFIGFGLRLLPSRLARAITNQAGVWVLGAAAPVTVVGAYARANSLAVRLNDAGYRVSELLFPALVERFRADRHADFKRLLADGTRLTVMPLLLISAAAGGAAAGLLKIFGEGFDDAANALALLLLTYCVYVLMMVQGQGFLAAGRPGATSWIGVVRAIVTITLMVRMAPPWGGTGIALALLLGAVLSWQMQVLMLRRWGLAAEPPLAELWSTVALVASTGAGFGVSRLLYNAFGPVSGTLAAVPAGMIAFAVVGVVTGWIRPDEVRRSWRALQARLVRRRS